MRGLMKFELRKMIESKLVWTVFALLVLYQIYLFIPIVVCDNALSTYVTEGGEQASSLKEGVLQNQKIANKYKGLLTNELISGILAESDLNYDNKIVSDTTISRYINYLFIDNEGIKSVKEVYPYMEDELNYGYSDSWEEYLYGMKQVAIIISFLIIVVMAPIFAYDYQNGTETIIMTSKEGRNLLIKAKLAVGFLITNIVTLYFLSVQIILYAFYFGLTGWDTSIQVGNLTFFQHSPINVNYLGLAILNILVLIASYNLIMVLTFVVSAESKNVFHTIIIVLILYALPSASFLSDFINQRNFHKVLCLFPVNAIDIMQPIHCEPVQIMGYQIPFFCVILLLFCTLIILGTYMTYRIVSNKRRV